jgi:hypothetical protein
MPHPPKGFAKKKVLNAHRSQAQDWVQTLANQLQLAAPGSAALQPAAFPEDRFPGLSACSSPLWLLHWQLALMPADPWQLAAECGVAALELHEQPACSLPVQPCRYAADK